MGDMALIDVDADEAERLVKALIDIGERLRTVAPQGVFLWRGLEDLTQQLLDVYVMLYEHIVIDVASIPGSLAGRAAYYCDAGVLTPVAIESQAYHGVNRRPSHFDDPWALNASLADHTVNLLPTLARCLPGNESRFVLHLIDQIAYLESHHAISDMAQGGATRLRSVYEATRHLHGGLDARFQRGISRLQRHQTFASLLGCTPLLEPPLAEFGIAMAKGPEPFAAHAPTTIESWYGSQVRSLPRLGDPSTVLQLRASAGDVFMDAFHAAAKKSDDPERTTALVAKRLDRKVLRYQRSRGQPLKHLGIGAGTTIGALVGGPFGAFIAGTSAAGIGYFSERWAAQQSEWPSMFVLD